MKHILPPVAWVDLSYVARDNCRVRIFVHSTIQRQRFSTSIRYELLRLVAGFYAGANAWILLL